MGCLYLTRGEGILLLPMAIGWVALNDRKWRWSILAGFLIIVLPWSIYSVIESVAEYELDRASGL